MTHSPFEDLIPKASQGVGLSTTERVKMRSFLREYMAFRPLQKKTAFSSQAVLSSWVVFIRRPAISLIAVLLIMIIGSGGVTLAAGGSLPGDMLYPVKVDLIEPTRTSLTFSTEAKVAWQRTLAERRLDEAAILADEDKLSTTTETALTANFEYNANAAAASEKDREGTRARNDASAEFAARLSVHESVLTKIAERGSRGQTDTIRNAIRTQIAKTARATTNAEVVPVTSGTLPITEPPSDREDFETRSQKGPLVPSELPHQ